MILLYCLGLAEGEVSGCCCSLFQSCGSLWQSRAGVNTPDHDWLMSRLMKSAVLFLSLQCFLPNLICLNYVFFSLIYSYWWLAVLCQPVPVAGMKRRELVFALLVIGDPVALRHCTRKESSYPRERVLWIEEDGQGVPPAYLELGIEPRSPEHLVQPPHYWSVHRLVWHSLLAWWFLIFGVLYTLAAALWK